MPTYRGGVPHDGGSEASSTAALPRGVDANGRHLLHKLEQLALGCPRVSQQQEVDVATAIQAVGETLAGATKQQAGDGFLDV